MRGNPKARCAARMVISTPSKILRVNTRTSSFAKEDPRHLE